MLLFAIVVAGALVAASPSAVAAEEPAPAANPRLAEAAALYDLWAAEQLAYNGVPGVVVGVVSRSGLVWAKGYGTTDLAGGVPLTPSTRFRIGSVSKVFTATAILQLRDAGKLRLDDPVVKHLPWFKVPKPFPDSPADHHRAPPHPHVGPLARGSLRRLDDARVPDPRGAAGRDAAGDGDLAAREDLPLLEPRRGAPRRDRCGRLR